MIQYFKPTDKATPSIVFFLFIIMIFPNYYPQILTNALVTMAVRLVVSTLTVATIVAQQALGTGGFRAVIKI